MFTILLRFSNNKSQAKDYMESHKEWIQRGFDDGVFLMAGSLQPSMGGYILAHNTPKDDLHQRVSEDPFVAEGVVVAEILEMSPNKAVDRLNFLVN